MGCSIASAAAHSPKQRDVAARVSRGGLFSSFPIETSVRLHHQTSCQPYTLAPVTPFILLLLSASVPRLPLDAVCRPCDSHAGQPTSSMCGNADTVVEWLEWIRRGRSERRGRKSVKRQYNRKQSIFVSKSIDFPSVAVHLCFRTDCDCVSVKLTPVSPSLLPSFRSQITISILSPSVHEGRKRGCLPRHPFRTSSLAASLLSKARTLAQHSILLIVLCVRSSVCLRVKGSGRREREAATRHLLYSSRVSRVLAFDAASSIHVYNRKEAANARGTRFCE